MSELPLGVRRPGVTSEFRVIKFYDESLEWLSVHEVKFDADGYPIEFEQTVAGVSGESLDELRQEFDAIGKAFTLPILDYAIFP